MTSMNATARDMEAARNAVLVARLVDPHDLNQIADRGGREHTLDQTALADLVHEALVESLRNRGAHEGTLWGDAAMAAELILQHVADVTSREEQSDSESDCSSRDGVSGIRV